MRVRLGLIAPILLLAACGSYQSTFTPIEDGGAGDDLAGEAPVDLAGQPVSDLAQPAVGLTTAVQVYVEPAAGFTPLTNAIKAAKSSIHLEMYLLTNSTLTNALITAKNRGVDVKIILEDNPTGSSNATVFNQLKTAGVAVQYGNPAFNFTHAKSMIIDGTALWAMTMNFSTAAVTDNREYILVDTDPGDIAEAEAIFQADWNRTKSTAARLIVAPDNATVRLLDLVRGAQSEIDIEWESFSESTIGNAVMERLRAGIKVKIMLPPDIAGSATETLMLNVKAAGAQIKTLANPYIHAKVFLIDRTRGFIGSENGTSNSLQRNRELGVAWRNAQVAAAVGAAFDSDFAAGTAF